MIHKEENGYKWKDKSAVLSKSKNLRFAHEEEM